MCHTGRGRYGREASRRSSELQPACLPRRGTALPCLTQSLAFTGANKPSCPRRHCWTRNATRTPTLGATAGSTPAPTQTSTRPSSSTAARSSRRRQLPRPERSAPGTSPHLLLSPLGWGQVLKPNCSPAGCRGCQTLDERGMNLYILLVLMAQLVGVPSSPASLSHQSPK